MRLVAGAPGASTVKAGGRTRRRGLRRRNAQDQLRASRSPTRIATSRLPVTEETPTRGR